MFKVYTYALIFAIGCGAVVKYCVTNNTRNIVFNDGYCDGYIIGVTSKTPGHEGRIKVSGFSSGVGTWSGIFFDEKIQKDAQIIRGDQLCRIYYTECMYNNYFNNKVKKIVVLPPVGQLDSIAEEIKNEL